MTAETDSTREGGFSPRQVRILKASVIIMGALIVLCIFALMAGIYYQSNKLGKTSADKNATDRSGAASVGSGVAAVRGAPVTLKVRPGAVVESQTAEGGLLILRLKSPEGTEISILDLKSGDEIRRIVLKAE
jgi:hypothetical protein